MGIDKHYFMVQGPLIVFEGLDKVLQIFQIDGFYGTVVKTGRVHSFQVLSLFSPKVVSQENHESKSTHQTADSH